MVAINRAEDTKEDLWFVLEDPFNAGEVIELERAKKEHNPTELEVRKNQEFQKICKTVQEELRKVINIDNENGEDSEVWLDRQHKAVIGDQRAVHHFIEEIKKVLNEKNISFKDYPDFYDSLAEAIFHEVWGLSVLAKWDKYQESEAAVVHGLNLWIDYGEGFKMQRERFNSEADVERVKRAFVHRREDSVLNRENPEIEIEREDGSRITMIQPPRSRENYIMLRRFVVDRFTLEDQAKRGTIPIEDIPIYRAIARTLPNTIVAGRVRSAKSTFMKTLIGERSKELVGGVLEKHFELALGKHFSDRLFFELQAKEGDLHLAIPRLLRMEHDYIVIGEIRSKEIEAFLQSTERGERGAISTYHLTDVHRVVQQLTRHTMDEFPTRRFDIELQRVAESVDLIITMASDRNRKTKRVTGVAEVLWDDENQKHIVNDIIKYSQLTKKYYYSPYLSKRLLFHMAVEDREETEILLRTLKERSDESPMEDFSNYQEIDNLLEEALQ